MPSFQISEAPSRLDMAARDASGAMPPAKATFLVRNMAPSAQVGRITVEPLDGARPEWFEIAGAPATSPGKVERDFVYGGNQSIDVTLRPPADAPAGNYGFRLRVAAEGDPDADFVQGPAVAFALAPAPVAAPPKRRIPWWIFAAAAAMVAVLLGVGGYLYLRPPANPMPGDLVGKSAEYAGWTVASQLGHDVRFDLSSQGSAAPLTVLATRPAAGKGVDEDEVVILDVRAPDGPCDSLICRFPGAVFPHDVVKALYAEDFDVKYTPALSIDNGRVRLDAGKLDEIRNAAPPEPMVRLPRLGAGQTVSQIQQTLADLGLGMELVSMTSGPEDGLVRRTEPAGPAELPAGSIVKVFYRPVPCTGRWCGVLQVQDPVLVMPKIMQDFDVQQNLRQRMLSQ